MAAAGIAAAGVYVAGDVVSGLLYPGYSFRDQWISELTARGSAVRPLMLGVLTLHGLLGPRSLSESGGRPAGAGACGGSGRYW